jgi:outer membrane immunogenic protein
MRKLFLSAGGFLVLAGAVVLAQGSALAASPDDLDVEKAQLRKENADLREILRMRKENAALRQQATSPAALSGETLRAESSARSEKPSVFQSYAADMPVKAAPPMRAALYNWTGFYVGANFGYSVGNDRTTTSLFDPGAVTSASPLTDFVVAPKGVLGGLQAGYNWQATRNWLVGFEADIQAANQTDTACSLACVTEVGATTDKFTTEQKLQYFGTLRGRLGVVSDNVLFYGTGGAAFGHVNQTVIGIQKFSFPPGAGATSSTAVAGETLFGWAAGGGIEAALSGNWTLKAEYLYMNLGDMKPNVFNGFTPGVPPTPNVATTNSTIRDHIVRVGINYRIGGDAPLSAYASASPRDAYAYAPVAPYNWTGFYAGGNAGYGQGVNRFSQPSGSILQIPTLGLADSVVAPKGFAGGVQIGYNLQGGRNWLVGFEADIQGTNQTDKACTPQFCLLGIAPPNPNTTLAFTAQQQLDWFGTVRGRVGVVNNNILFYGTAGVAFGQFKQTIAENLNSSPTSNFTTIATSHNLTGWTAGGGIEAALWGNWTAKAEYLYLDFGSVKSTFDDGAAPGQGLGRVDNVSTVRDHIFRAGVNYRFGEPGPVVAKY